MKKIIAALLAVVMVLVLVTSPIALGKSDKVTICHAAGRAGTTHYTTLTIGYNAVYGPAGHFYENGTPRAGHEEDYLGPCKTTEPTPSPSMTTPTPSTTPPSSTPTPTPAESAAPTPTPSSGESTPPTLTPTPSLIPNQPRVTLPPTDTDGTIETLGQVALTGLIVYLLLGIIGTVAFAAGFIYVFRNIRKP